MIDEYTQQLRISLGRLEPPLGYLSERKTRSLKTFCRQERVLLNR